MRVTCSIATINRAQGVPSRSSKAIRTIISITRKGDEAVLMLSTARKASGRMYKLKCNVEKIFSRLCGKGIATLRLKDPQVDLQISLADAEEVSRLLKAIRLANQGQSLLGLGVLSTPEPPKKKAISKGPIHMKIASRSEYPISGFPQSLQQLTIDGCRLKQFDIRILRLRNLTSLAIINNNIQELPHAIADLMCLTDLNLESNMLTEFPSRLCERNSTLCASLKVLIVNHNRIRYLPENFGNLSNLISLHINNNRLRYLPYDIGRLQNLKFLYAKENKILFIPVTVRKLSLLEIDLSRNEFLKFGTKCIVNRLSPTAVLSLQDLSCKVIVKEKILFEEEDLPLPCRNLIRMARKCVFCPTVVFRNYIRMPMKFDLGGISQTVLYCQSARKHAPLDCYICSRQCFDYTPKAF